MSKTVADEPTTLINDDDISRLPRDTRKPYQKQLAVYLILASTLFERLAFYSLSSNLVLYLQSNNLKWDSKPSVTAVNIFYGVSYVFGIVFAIISDAKLGRALTISIGYMIYLIGYTFLTIIANGKTVLCQFSNNTHNNESSLFHQYCGPTIVPALICTAIGASAVQVNTAVFGVEQTRELGTKSRYFDKHMIVVNIGAIIATSAIPYIQQSNASKYFTAYLVSVSMLVCSILLFNIGRPYYTHVKPYDTIVLKCFPVVIDAFRTWRRHKKDQRSIDNLTGRENDQRSIGPLDYAKTINHGRFHEGIVDDVKSLRGAFIVFTLLIPYWLVYDQRDSTFPLQGQHMNYFGIQGRVSWVSLGDSLVIIFGLLILNLFDYKYMDKYQQTVSITTKFIIGMIIGCMTMGVTGIVEIERQNHCNTSDVSSLNIAFQIPQWVGIGLSEVFAVIASYEYSYFCAPRSAASLFMSLRFCSSGLSSFLNTALMYAFPSTSVELDFTCLPSRKEYRWSFYAYFFILGGVLFLSMIVIILCQKKFRIIKLNSEKLQQNHHSSTLAN